MEKNNPLEYEITRESAPSDEERNQKGYPPYLSRLKFTEQEEKDYAKEAMEEFDLIAEERKSAGWDSYWEELDEYYDGSDTQIDDDRLFSLHKPTVKIKSDAVCRAMGEAFFESEPIISVTPSPKTIENNLEDILPKQEDFLDFKLRYLPIRDQYDLVFHSAVYKGIGLLKWYHEIDLELQDREEKYESFNDPNTGVNEELKRFMENHAQRMIDKGETKALERYISQFRNHEGKKDIYFNVKEEVVIFNDPLPTFVNNLDFYVRLDTRKNFGLRNAHTFERIEYTLRELLDKADEDEFYNIDKLKEVKYNQDSKKEEKIDDQQHLNDKISVLMCVRYIKYEGEKKKVILWITEKEKIMIGSSNYPNNGIPSLYVAHYIERKNQGFYEDGLGKRLIDTNIADDFIMNLTLEAAVMANTITPLCYEDSPMLLQFSEKQFSTGVPLILGEDESNPRFLNEFLKPPDIAGLLALRQDLERTMDDASGVSSIQQGRESIADPQASGRKTMLLLEQSGINIRDFIRVFRDGFNITADILLQMYGQINDEAGFAYKIHPERVVQGNNPFGVITRDELLARTTKQANALNFDFERMNFNKLMLAYFTTVQGNPIFNSNPNNVYHALRLLTKSWHPWIKDRIDLLLPNPEQWQKQLKILTAQGVQQFMVQTMKQSQLAGQPMPIDPNELLNTVSVLLKDAGTAPPKEELKAREG